MALEFSVIKNDGREILPRVLGGKSFVKLGGETGKISLVNGLGFRDYSSETPISGDVFTVDDFPRTDKQTTQLIGVGEELIIDPEGRKVQIVDTKGVLELEPFDRIKLIGLPLTDQELVPDPENYLVKAEVRVVDNEGNVVYDMRAPSHKGALHTIALIPNDQPFAQADTLMRVIVGDASKLMYLELGGFRENDPDNWMRRSVDDPPETIPAVEGQFLVGYHPFGSEVERFKLEKGQKIEVQAIRW